LGAERAAAAAFARAGGGPVDAAMAALLREGVAPRAEALERLRRAMARAGSGKGIFDADERLSLAARLEAAGIPAEPWLVEAVEAQAEGGSDAGDSETGDASGGSPGGGPEAGGSEAGTPGGDNPGGSGAGDPGGIDPNRELDLEIPESELPKVLGRLLRGIAFRWGGSGSYLNLFNHTPGPEGSWIYAPFAFELDSIAFEGDIRIQSPRLRGGPGRIEASFFSRASGESGSGRRWSLELDFGARTALRLDCDDEGAARAARRGFPALRGQLAAGGKAVEAAFAASGTETGKADAEGIAGGLDVEA
jgi:hypothetical protein